MKVNTVSASIRYSRPVGDGSFKTVEISAEGAVEPNENWQDAQSNLYDNLAGLLRQIWTQKGQKANGNQVTNTNGVGTAKKSLSGPNTPEMSNNNKHYCITHNREYRRYEKNGHEWYSHKTDDGWCNERKV